MLAVDSGLDIAADAGVQPSLAIGDFDSVSDRRLLHTMAREDVVSLAHDKDETDAEMAVREASARGADHIVLLGGGGGRLDHLLGLLWLFERTPAPSLWITDSAEVHRVEGFWSRSYLLGQVLSVFPVAEGPWSARSAGLRWALDGISWRRSDAGLSNETVTEHVSVTADAGRFLVVVPFGEQRFTETE